MIRNNIHQTNQAFRNKLNFNSDWLFYRGEIDSPVSANYDDKNWERVILPHTVRLEPKEWEDSPSFQGISWYRRHFTLDPIFKGKKIYVQFEGAMINTDVWVNGHHLLSHNGGYLPFVIDLTEVIVFGEDNVITVKIDSNDNWETPPGKPQNELDFVYFGGLYRNVHLIITDRLHITDAILANKVADGGVFITYPDVNNKKATVRIQSNVLNEYNEAKQVHLEAMIIDKDDQTVLASGNSGMRLIQPGSDETFVQTLTVTNPILWSMDHPHLYTVVIQVKAGHQQTDIQQIQIGIRRIEFTVDEGFLMNGDRVLLNGVNHHEDYLYIGNAVSESMLYRDVKMIKEAGFNFIRTGHYPHHQAFMNACDELGIAVIVPTPGWQYYTEEGDFATRSLQMTRNMIRLFRNHPSVIVWEPVLNETWYPETFAQEAYRVVHEEYPTDQAYAASDFGAPNGKQFDVVYKEAYSETRPLITREWGDANHNIYDGERSGRKFGEKSLMNSSLHRQNSLKGNKWKNEEDEDGYWDWAGLNANKRIAGYALWSFNDYNRGMSKEIAYSGIVDRDRHLKFNYYWFQSQQSPTIDHDPMIFIANYWLESSPRDVHIYTNTEEVKLYLNDKYIGTKKHPIVDHIQNPIIIFEDIPWEQGRLRAEGFINGVAVTTHTVTTPGDPHHLSIKFNTFGIREMVANGSDMIMAYVYVKDIHGSIVPTNDKDISLHLSGPGILVGNGEERVKANPVQTEAGIAPALIRSTLLPGDITITATATGLKSGQAVVKSIPYLGQFVPSKLHNGNHLIDGINVALHKPVTVSSEQKDNKGENINDGNTETYWLPNELDQNQWVLIDLEKNFNLIGLQLLWTSHKFPKKYKIDVSEDQKNWITMVNQSDNEQNEQIQFERFDSNARYICIRLFNQEKIEGITEVKIFGRIQSIENYTPTIERRNISARKITNASSFSPGNEPSMAVNQQLHTMWQAGTYDLPQWLQVDLGECQSISGAKILWGKDSTHYTYKIQVSKNGESWSDVVNQTTTGSHFHPIDFNAVIVRYVRVYIDNLLAGGGAEKVAIKELEVYSAQSCED